MVKTMEDLKYMRDQFNSETHLRYAASTQIIVGMGTCGIAAGAREVMIAVLDELARRRLQDVTVRQTGCIGMCEQEVLVDVVRPGEPRITYGKVLVTDVPKIIGEHVVNGRIVKELAVAKITD
ncbi:(2Fe-2S) ferredoxin domain-containing protein [Sporomusa acidovorans]|uniref:NADP-reducing hydrogenase subunit HndB n=1 Tax=Sporomusa acidovorans (strain ATCC 49682 / DSM 3132 / Mol) TaxID=1123286 RepID=A0ABZ3IW91_SPOA4|nr:(2Fe-2S) ferredoxin domain-containing protein [Sporomusa acidovorans]OZC17985.1 NADP-reducing hydrogenase subunit HndB [Sporomusa acidovorans DSM 3132]SDF42115.1 NAD(P)-dependent iron-only hydrogenase iron-sulfur protein [Sporomusa acidovorans]